MSTINKLVTLTTYFLNKANANPYSNNPQVKIGSPVDLAIYLLAAVIYKDDQNEFDTLVLGLQKVIHPALNNPLPYGQAYTNSPFGPRPAHTYRPEGALDTSVDAAGHALLTQHVKAHVALDIRSALEYATDIINSLSDQYRHTQGPHQVLALGLLRSALYQANEIAMDVNPNAFR